MHAHIRHLPLALFLLTAPVRAQLAREANTTLAMPEQLPAASGFTTENALGSLTFSAPICAMGIPGQTNVLFVAERNNGTIQRVNLAANPPTKSTWFTISTSTILAADETRATDGENGFLSFALHPQFASNGILFLFYSVRNAENTAISGTEDGFQRIHRVVVSNPLSGNTAVMASHQPLVTQFDQATNHNGGDMAFGPDGYLYVSVGDEGGGGDTYNNARFINRDFFGGVMRIDVDKRPGNPPPNAHTNYLNTARTLTSTSFPSAIHRDGLGNAHYSVPADNPFIGLTSWHNLPVTPASIRTEFWATGLRNPWRFSFDAPTGRLFLADVGQQVYEEINIITRGGDYGWSWREGLHAFATPPSPATPPASGFNPIDPIYEYDHTNDGSGSDAVIYGAAITGGTVMRGNRLPELLGQYIFCDYSSGIVAALREEAGGWVGTRLAVDAGVAETAVDPRNGDVLLLDHTGSQVKRLARSGITGNAPPATLSGTGAFSNLATLTPSSGVVPYSLNQPFWSDHAIKSRWFSIPNVNDDLGWSPESPWTAPAGTVWIKHFEMEMTRGDPQTRRRLETRLLVRNATGAYGVTYRWRANQTDADLVPENGQTEVLSIVVNGQTVNQTWFYPSRTDCMTCHTPNAGFALGFNTRQLNRLMTYGSVATNQLTALAQAGYFANAVPDPAGLPRHLAANETQFSVEQRARSYLAVNCGYCHQPGGAVIGSWDGREHVSLSQTGLINGSAANSMGDPQNRLIVPGDTAHSIVWNRAAATNGFSRMPPLGSTVVDPAGVALLAEWIGQSLTNRQTYAEWRLARFGSANSPGGEPGFDADADGADNHSEFIAGTAPLSGASRPALQLQVLPANGRVRFTAADHRSMLVQQSTNLVDWVTWPAPGNVDIPRSPGPVELEGPLTGERRFLRLQIDWE